MQNQKDLKDVLRLHKMKATESRTHTEGNKLYTRIQPNNNISRINNAP